MNIMRLIFTIGITAATYYMLQRYDIGILSIYNNSEITNDSNEDDQNAVPNILPKEWFKVEHTKNPYQDYGKVFEKISDIISRGELVVCAKKDDNNVLFQMKTKDGEYIGKDIDFAKQIAAVLNVKVSYRMIYDTYDDVVDAVANKEGDIGIAKVSYTTERSKKVFYSSPYVVSRKTLLINRSVFENVNNNTFTNLLNPKSNKAQDGVRSDITLLKLLNKKGAVIGVAKDTCYESFAKKVFPKATILSDSDWSGKIIKKLVNKEIDATMRDEVRVKLLLESDPSLLVKLIPIIIEKERDSISAIINLDCPEFLLWLNNLIEVDVQLSDTVDDLMDKYKRYL